MRELLKGICVAVILLGTNSVAQAGDADAGSKVFRKCAACHNAEEPKNKVGPHLVGIIERPIASLEDYKYSKAMIAFAEADKVWNEELMREYFAAPRAVVRGTRMAFVGLKKQKDLDNLIAYFKSLESEN